MWYGSIVKKRHCWVSWEAIYKPKEDRGIDIKYVSLFNKALLTKWLWRFLKDVGAIWVGILEERYENLAMRLVFKDGFKIKSQESLCWRDLMLIGDSMDDVRFSNPLTFRLGDGVNISFWSSKWFD